MATKKEKRKPIDFEYEDFIVWFGKKYHTSHWNIIKDLDNAGADARKNWKHLAQFLKNDGFTPSQVFDLAMESHKFELPKLKNLEVLRIIINEIHKRKREKIPVTINGIIKENLEKLSFYGNFINEDKHIRAITEVYRRYRKRPFKERLWINAIVFSDEYK